MSSDLKSKSWWAHSVLQSSIKGHVAGCILALGWQKSLFLQNKSWHFHYLQKDCKTMNALENMKKHAEWNLSHYTATTHQTRQSSDTHPSNTSAVPDSAPVYTKQPTCHCKGMKRGREKHVWSDLLASGRACFCFCNASPSINRTHSAVIYYSWNSHISNIDLRKVSSGKKLQGSSSKGEKIF